MKKLAWLPAVVCLTIMLGWGLRLPAEEPGDDVVQAIINLLTDKDKDVRALGLEQVRGEAKGAAATKRFAEVLPKLPPEGQVGLLDALADRGDAAALPAARTLLKSPAAPVQAAALRALGPLGGRAELPVLIESLTAAPPLKTAAHGSLVRLTGADINRAIAAALPTAKPAVRAELLGILATRRAADCVPAMLAAADDANPVVRNAAQAALGELAGPEVVGVLAKAVLKARTQAVREAAEKVVMFVCSRAKDPNRRADPLLTVMAGLGEDDYTILLPTLGRVGGGKALKVVEKAIAAPDPQRHEAGLRALCNWPDGSVCQKLYHLASTSDEPAVRTMALAALIRVAPLPDKRPDAVRLDWLKKAMQLASKDEERKLVLKRARAIRTIETLRFVAPYMEQPTFAQQACATVAELAHHKALRDPNKPEFDRALDTVIRISQDPQVVDQARHYKKGQTWVPPRDPAL